jgi:hypothetical protein
MAWKFVGSTFDGALFEISGADVWTHHWNRIASERVVVIDPHYGQEYQFGVYEIAQDGRHIKFAAGEFSNGVWGGAEE